MTDMHRDHVQDAFNHWYRIPDLQGRFWRIFWMCGENIGNAAWFVALYLLLRYGWWWL